MDPLLQTSAFELAPGSRIGNYEVLRKLAVGGMAEIYLVRVTGVAGFEKLMVLKRILPSVAGDPRFVDMFLNEARLAATLRHPNIADVLDVGESDGSYFFTMEYVHGEEVRSIRHATRARNEAVPLPIALAIVHGVATALHHAHEKVGSDGKPLGLVHRDVSSNNVMVSYDGAVKLLDFGVARVTSETHETQSGTLRGKVPYMSPEQCRCVPLDRRSDLYSLGVILYELTVGRRPFRGDTQFAIMEQIIHGAAAMPSSLVQGYPPDLEAMVMKLLSRAPADRYPTGDAFLHELDDFIAKHGQWLSSRAIGRYMRTLFADKIEAWEHAQEEGVAFAEHIASTITSNSLLSDSVVKSVHELAPEAATKPDIPQRMSEPFAVFQPIRPVRPSSAMPTVRPTPPSVAAPPPPAPIDDAIASVEASMEESSRHAAEPHVAEPPSSHESEGSWSSRESEREEEPPTSRYSSRHTPPPSSRQSSRDIAIPASSRESSRHIPVAPSSRESSRHTPPLSSREAAEAPTRHASEPPSSPRNAHERPVSYPTLPSKSKAGVVLGILVLLALGAGGVFAFQWLQADVEKQRLGPLTGGGKIEMSTDVDAGTRSPKSNRSK